MLDADGRWSTGAAVRGPAARPRRRARVARPEHRSSARSPGSTGRARMLARPARGRAPRSLGRRRGHSLEDRDDTLAEPAHVVPGRRARSPCCSRRASATCSRRPASRRWRRCAGGPGEISLDAGERLPLPAAHDEIHRLGETLNEMLARLEASFERERRFVADASHELRTPLAVLKTELEAAIRSGGDGAEARESLVAALEETDHLAQLAEDLLVIARAADGRLPVRRERVDAARAARAHPRSLRRPGSRAGARDPSRWSRGDEPFGRPGARAPGARQPGRQRAAPRRAATIRLPPAPAARGARDRGHRCGPRLPAELAPRAFERFARGGWHPDARRRRTRSRDRAGDRARPTGERQRSPAQGRGDRASVAAGRDAQLAMDLALRKVSSRRPSTAAPIESKGSTSRSNPGDEIQSQTRTGRRRSRDRPERARDRDHCAAARRWLRRLGAESDSSTVAQTSTKPAPATIPQPTHAQLAAADLAKLPLAPDSERLDIVAPTFSNPTEITNPLFPISDLHSAVPQRPGRGPGLSTPRPRCCR